MEDATPTANGPTPRRSAARKSPPASATQPAAPPPAAGPRKARKTSAAEVRTDTATTAVPPRPAKKAPTKKAPAAKATPAPAQTSPAKAARKAAVKAPKPPSGPKPGAQARTGSVGAGDLEQPFLPEPPEPLPVAPEPGGAEPGGAEPAQAQVSQPAGGETARPSAADHSAADPDHQRVPLWAWLVADPGYAPQHAARQAVRRIGPEARDWVARMRDRYPGASPDGLARLAATEFSRDARRHGAIASAAGVLGSIGATGVIAQEQARLVLAVAAAYGFDPLARERADDLLVLLRLPRLNQPSLPALADAGRLLAGVAVRQVAARLIPFGAALTGAVQGRRGCDEAARRATAYYRTLTRS